MNNALLCTIVSECQNPLTSRDFLGPNDLIGFQIQLLLYDF